MKPFYPSRKFWKVLPVALASAATWFLLFALMANPAAVAAMMPLEGPVVYVPVDITAVANSTVDVPVNFQANGNNVSSMLFSIDYDETWLEFDPAVANAVVMSLPNGFIGSCSSNVADPTAEINCLIYYPSAPLAALPSGKLVTLKLQTKNAPANTVAVVGFSTTIPASFGNDAGQAVAGLTQNGSVKFQCVGVDCPVTTTVVPTTVTPTTVTPTTVTPTTVTPSVTPSFTARAYLAAVMRFPLPLVTTPAPTTAVPTTPVPTTTTPTPPPGCNNFQLQNLTFEPNGGYWYMPPTVKTALYTSYRSHSPNYSVYTGIDPSIEPGANLYSYSSVRSNGDATFVIPANATRATLKYWHYSTSTGGYRSESSRPQLQSAPKAGKPLELDPASSDIQYVLALDYFNNVVGSPVWELANQPEWNYREVNLLPWAGQSIKLQFGTFNNGAGGTAAMYIDDVYLEVCVP